MKQKLVFKLNRKHKKADYTIGDLGYEGFDENGNVIENIPFLCNVLEDKWSDFKNGIKDKIPGKTAIPDGTYKIVLYMSPRFGRILPNLLNVLYYTSILIHGGNKAEDTDGCLLPGKNDKPGWVSNSLKYENKITSLVKEYKECWIIIE